MGKLAAKATDTIEANEIHTEQPPGPVSPLPIPHTFSGKIDGNLSRDVKINGQYAAMCDSTANNMPPHIPKVGAFIAPISNQATIRSGSDTVKINGRAAARDGDSASTCCEANPMAGTVRASGNVKIG